MGGMAYVAYSIEGLMMMIEFHYENDYGVSVVFKWNRSQTINLYVNGVESESFTLLHADVMKVMEWCDDMADDVMTRLVDELGDQA
jgi:hypothetical protein